MFSSKKNIKYIVAAISSAALIIRNIPAINNNSAADFKYQTDIFAMDTIVSVKSESDITKDISDIFYEYAFLLDSKSDLGGTHILNQSRRTSSAQLCDIISDVLKLNKEYGTLTDITIGSCTQLWNVTAENPQVPSDEEIAKALETVSRHNIALNGDSILLKNGCLLDFGAVGKGVALDKCHEYLSDNSCDRTFISTGSSMLFWDMDMENVSITDPDGGILAKVSSDYSFLSTSGGYERYFEADGKTYCHIIDPRTGRPTETDLTTVTVFCDSGLLSDFLSTAIFIDGSENIGKYLNSDEYKIFAADKNKKLYISDGIEYEVYDDVYTE